MLHKQLHHPTLSPPPRHLFFLYLVPVFVYKVFWAPSKLPRRIFISHLFSHFTKVKCSALASLIVIIIPLQQNHRTTFYTSLECLEITITHRSNNQIVVVNKDAWTLFPEHAQTVINDSWYGCMSLSRSQYYSWADLFTALSRLPV